MTTTKTTTKTNAAKTTEADRHVQLADLDRQSSQGHRRWVRARDVAADYRRTSTFQNLERRKDIDPDKFREQEVKAIAFDDAADQAWGEYQDVAKRAEKLRQKIADEGKARLTDRMVDDLHARTVRVLRPMKLGGEQRAVGDIVECETLVRNHGLRPARLRLLDALGWVVGLTGGDGQP